MVATFRIVLACIWLVIMFLLVLWYTEDDWLASVTGQVWIGNIPFFAWVIVCAVWLTLDGAWGKIGRRR